VKGKILLRLLLAAVIVVTVAGSLGPAQAPPQFDSTGVPSARPCASDSDCPGGQICCPINGLCTNQRGCKKDPL
jgi:hypothetical protein